MTNLKSQAAELTAMDSEERLRDDLKLIQLQAQREGYEKKRDLNQMFMDACDKLIHEINLKRVS